MIGVALLGAGIFAREQYVPAITDCPSLALRAIYSRSEEMATTTAALATSSQSSIKPDVYFDSPGADGKSLEDLLARDDISAVIICLPIPVQAGIIQKAITAGKHVLSEKPIARDIASARDLIALVHGQPTVPVWAVAENFRFIDSVQYAAEQLRCIGGQLVSFRLSFSNFISKENKYFQTEWRKFPDFQGGFLLDGGVHFIAVLRLLLSAVEDEIEEVIAYSTLLEDHLIPVDTIHAVAATKSGRSGTISLSFGTKFKSGLEIDIVTTKGALTWTPTKVQCTTASDSGDITNQVKEFVYNNAVKMEINAFFDSLSNGSPDPLQTPLEALKDLAIMQALLESAEGHVITKIIEG